MTREFFNKQFMALIAAYSISSKIPDEAEDVYWEMLRGIPEKEFHNGVRKCLATCKWFPTIAELGTASMPPVECPGRWIQTKNGMDRPLVQVGWEQQLREIERQEFLSDKSEVMGLVKEISKGSSLT